MDIEKLRLTNEELYDDAEKVMGGCEPVEVDNSYGSMFWACQTHHQPYRDCFVERGLTAQLAKALWGLVGQGDHLTGSIPVRGHKKDSVGCVKCELAEALEAAGIRNPESKIGE